MHIWNLEKGPRRAQLDREKGAAAAQLDRRGRGRSRVAGKSEGRESPATGTWDSAPEGAGVRQGPGTPRGKEERKVLESKEDATDSLLLRVPSAGQPLSGERSAGSCSEGGGSEDWGRAREASEPGNFLPSPQHPGDAGDAWRLGERAGLRPETVHKGLIGAESRCLAGPPTRPLEAGGATSSREKAGSQVAEGYPTPSQVPGRAEGEWRVGCGAGDPPGRGARGCNKEDVFPDLGDPEGPGL